jgi:hypothetical protein
MSHHLTYLKLNHSPHAFKHKTLVEIKLVTQKVNHFTLHSLNNNNVQSFVNLKKNSNMSWKINLKKKYKSSKEKTLTTQKKFQHWKGTIWNNKHFKKQMKKLKKTQQDWKKNSNEKSIPKSMGVL